MPGEQQDYKAFRQRLDAVLRQRDPAALRAFLVAEGQWQPDAQTDAEAAMWMMIAASPALKDLRGDAERWLLTHGHEAEAGAILGTRRTTPTSAGPNRHQAAPRSPASSRSRRTASSSGRPASKPRSATRPGASSRPDGTRHASGRHAPHHGDDLPPSPPSDAKSKPRG